MNSKLLLFIVDLRRTSPNIFEKYVLCCCACVDTAVQHQVVHWCGLAWGREPCHTLGHLALLLLPFD